MGEERKKLIIPLAFFRQKRTVGIQVTKFIAHECECLLTLEMTDIECRNKHRIFCLEFVTNTFNMFR